MDVEQLMTFLISPERTIVEAMEKIDENGPVSYTHLDVYKRQVFRNSLRH